MAEADITDITDYVAEARELLARGRRHLATGRLHRASRRGWEAAALMARAVAAAQGWEYEHPDHFSVLLNRAWKLTGEDRLLGLRGIANDLRGNYHRRKRHLDAEAIREDIESVAELLEILAPLAGSPDRG